MRPDLAPCACRAHQRAGPRRLLRRHRVPIVSSITLWPKPGTRPAPAPVDRVRISPQKFPISRNFIAAPWVWHAHKTRTAPTASFSSSLNARNGSTANTRFGGEVTEGMEFVDMIKKGEGQKRHGSRPRQNHQDASRRRRQRLSQRVSSRMASSRPPSVSGNMRSSIRSRIIETDCVWSHQSRLIGLIQTVLG